MSLEDMISGAVDPVQLVRKPYSVRKTAVRVGRRYKAKSRLKIRRIDSPRLKLIQKRRSGLRFKAAGRVRSIVYKRIALAHH